MDRHLPLNSLKVSGADDENNNKQWDPLKNILNFLLCCILVVIPLCFYDVYMADGLFSRRFVDFALSVLLVLLMFVVASKVIGVNNENHSKKLEIHGVSVNLLLMLLNLILVPLCLHEVYLTDGIFSYHFTHFAVCTCSLVFIHLGLSGIISSRTCAVLILPGFISFIAILQWDLLSSVSLAGWFPFVIAFSYMLMVYEKGFGKNSDGTSEKEV